MKKNYIKPSVEKIILKHNAALLVGSNHEYADGKKGFFTDDCEEIGLEYPKQRSLWDD